LLLFHPLYFPLVLYHIHFRELWLYMNKLGILPYDVYCVKEFHLAVLKVILTLLYHPKIYH